MWPAIFAVAIGSALGGVVRWALGRSLDVYLSAIPLGTLAANLGAGYLVGLALAGFAQAPGLAPEWRLFIITGLCGGLSTFSTFSGEVVGLLQRGQWVWAMAAIALHLGGSLLMTLAGMASWQIGRG